MKKTIIPIFSFLILLFSHAALAQDPGNDVIQDEKIRGFRFAPYPNYPGAPFLNDKFLMGEVELVNGTRIGNIGLNYGTYRDELIYYNTKISAQIVIDKMSLKGFSFYDKSGRKRVFRRQYFTGSFQGDCFFEVLSDGKISLLVFRKVNLETCNTYYSKSGMAYEPAYTYYLYEAGKGYLQLNPTRMSLLSKFSKQDQKAIRKMLRKNEVIVMDEPTFVQAWQLIEERGLQPIF